MPVFRIYKQGSTNFQDWNTSNAFPYNSTNRATILDPNGGSARYEITSIPSPFARIDLVKNAFGEVVSSKDLDGDTIYHKMVSDSLDVSEIFFKIKQFKKIEIIPWDVNSNVQELKMSSLNGHNVLGDVLEKYFKAGADIYNFDKTQYIYLLNYLEGPNPLNIIGATSPSTLFFSNANDLNYLSKIIPFNTDLPFDSKYRPLYKRDPDLIRNWFLLKYSMPNFAAFFPEVNEYLNQTYSKINDQRLKNELQSIDTIQKQNLLQLDITYHGQSHIVEVLGNPLYYKQTSKESINSDFELVSTKQTQNKILVLPVESGTKYAQLYYVTDIWGKDAKAPFIDDNPLGKRNLPHDGSQIDYLTIGDLLEDYIIKVPHTMNNMDFYCGGINEPQLSYLLPLKPSFFDYFAVDDLIKGSKKKQNSQLPSITMRALAGGGVSVKLMIPIKGNKTVNYIEYSRLYHDNQSADIANNTGGVHELDFFGSIMPLVQFANPKEALYKIACMHSPNEEVNLLFYNEGQNLRNVDCGSRHYDGLQLTLKTDAYSIEKQLFDMIVVKSGGCKGIMIPILRKQNEIDTFEFAVDLGTSNTHIELKKEGQQTSEPFNYSQTEGVISFMFKQSLIKLPDGSLAPNDLINEYETIDRDFIPIEINSNIDFHFPTSTILALGKQSNSSAIVPFIHANIPITHDRRPGVARDRYIDDIKWGGNPEAQSYMNKYIDCLMLMVRNKVVANNGKLSNTSIKWFYPSSMPNRRLTWLKQAWDNAYKIYFGNVMSTQYMTESYAPIQYYFKQYATATNLVNIDIGGGTTDVAYANNNKVLFTTSFQFAANNLFSDAYSLNGKNGIIDFYKNEILNVIRDNKIYSLEQFFDDYNTKPANMASFLFSLQGISFLRKINPEAVDLTKKLQSDDDFRIIFLLFYCAIIYHVAHVIKLHGYPIPRHVSFSGNGSKSLNIITPNSKLLSKLTLSIFKKVIGSNNDTLLDILGFGNSSFAKESTCKGGLYGNQPDTEIYNLIMRAQGDRFIDSNDLYTSIRDVDKASVIDAVKQFFNVFLNLDKELDFYKTFGVTREAMSEAKELFNSPDLFTFLERGIALAQAEGDGSGRIEETFFFYPIKGILQELSNRIFSYRVNPQN